MSVRGVRGATVASHDQPEAILDATTELLQALMEANPQIRSADIASALFTVTDDLGSEYPARAAREFGWDTIPLLCAREIPVPGSLELCIRVLLHWNTEIPQSDIRHVYLGNAARLRPDLGKVDN